MRSQVPPAKLQGLGILGKGRLKLTAIAWPSLSPGRMNGISEMLEALPHGEFKEQKVSRFSEDSKQILQKCN